jgi:SAM-dependent methyltransferase
MPLSGSPQMNHFDWDAWERFCSLIDEGAGAVDSPSDAAVKSARGDRRFLLGLVDHHRINNVPFLVERCHLMGKEVIEIGAGTGGLSVAMALDVGCHVTAVEPNKLNCEAGMWRTRAYRLEDRIDFHHVADTGELSFADARFDAAVLSSVLQYVPSRAARRRLLHEAWRVVRPGGLLAICGSGNGLLPGGPHSTSWWSNLLPERAARHGHKRGVTFFELHDLLSPLGARPLRPAHRQDTELMRWRARVGVRGHTLGRRFLYKVVFSAFAAGERLLCPLAKAPIEAFAPFPSLAFIKPLSLADRIEQSPPLNVLGLMA